MEYTHLSLRPESPFPIRSGDLPTPAQELLAEKEYDNPKNCSIKSYSQLKFRKVEL
jgi:hypothetical protein